jgi:hypothetical protein
MKWSNLCYAMMALLGMVTSASAGHCGAEKSCGCTPNCQPKVCRPVICKPACPTKHTYQRQIACCKPTCSLGAAPSCCRPVCPCATPAPTVNCAPSCGPMGCGPVGCGPVATGPACAAPAACGPTGPACAAPANCGPAACGPAAGPACAAPAACGPTGPACAAPAACGPAAGANCAAPASCTAPTSCATECVKTKKAKCCDACPFEVAGLIYCSQTACHGKQRAKAIDKLGDKFDCSCNPEIMVAFVYALNDSDERVRYQAADEIGDQLRKNPCCLNDAIVCALTQALGDCDKRVVRAATRALCIAGYDVKDCEVACNTCAPSTGCTTGGGCVAAAPVAAPAVAAPAPVAAPVASPASATETKEPEAYFPGRLKDQSTSKKSALQNLFGAR